MDDYSEVRSLIPPVDLSRLREAAQAMHAPVALLDESPYELIGFSVEQHAALPGMPRVSGVLAHYWHEECAAAGIVCQPTVRSTPNSAVRGEILDFFSNQIVSSENIEDLDQLIARQQELRGELDTSVARQALAHLDGFNIEVNEIRHGDWGIVSATRSEGAFAYVTRHGGQPIRLRRLSD